MMKLSIKDLLWMAAGATALLVVLLPELYFRGVRTPTCDPWRSLSTRSAIAFGRPHRAVAEIAERRAADLIVMGTGRRGIKSALFGNVVERTRRIVRVPLLSVGAGDRS